MPRRPLLNSPPYPLLQLWQEMPYLGIPFPGEELVHRGVVGADVGVLVCIAFVFDVCNGEERVVVEFPVLVVDPDFFVVGGLNVRCGASGTGCRMGGGGFERARKCEHGEGGIVPRIHRWRLGGNSRGCSNEKCAPDQKNVSRYTPLHFRR